MARRIKDAIDINTGDRIYFTGHAAATFLSNGKTVEQVMSGTVNKADYELKLNQINADLRNINAGQITDGVINIERLPHGSLERIHVVSTDAERLALTTENVQTGDTVKVVESGVMYFVVNDSKLDSEDGYEVYTSGVATSVPWSGVIGAPDFALESDLNTVIARLENYLPTSGGTVNGNLDIGIDGTTTDAKYFRMYRKTGDVRSRFMAGMLDSHAVELSYYDFGSTYNALTIGRDGFSFTGGNVAIGSETADEKLHVHGAVKANSVTISSGSDSKIRLDNTDTETKYQQIVFLQNGTEYGRLGTYRDDNICWNTKPILHSGNYSDLLAGGTINGSLRINKFLAVGAETSQSNTARAQINLVSSGANPCDLYFGADDTLYWSLTARNAEDAGGFNKAFALYDVINSAYRMIMFPNGNLAIGGTTTSAKLDVYTASGWTGSFSTPKTNLALAHADGYGLAIHALTTADENKHLLRVWQGSLTGSQGSGKELFSVYSNGTTNVGGTLDVNGNIKAKSTILSGASRNVLSLKTSDTYGPQIKLYVGDTSVAGIGCIPKSTSEQYGTYLTNESANFGLLLGSDKKAYLTTDTQNLTKTYEIIHSGNYSSYALPLSGGTVTGTTTFNAEVKMIKAGSSDICVGVACDLKSNRSQISNLITNYIYLGRESTDKNIRFRSYSTISSSAPSSITDLLVIGSSGCIASNFITSSDRRVKKNIVQIDDAKKSLELNFYEFDYVNNDNHSAGHVAQEVKEVLPEFVHGNESETEHLSIDYTGLHSMQIKALKDEINLLKKENKELRKSNNELNTRVDKLHDRISELEYKLNDRNS